MAGKRKTLTTPRITREGPMLSSRFCAHRLCVCLDTAMQMMPEITNTSTEANFASGFREMVTAKLSIAVEDSGSMPFSLADAAVQCTQLEDVLSIEHRGELSTC
jgi:hypothetical protein